MRIWSKIGSLPCWESSLVYSVSNYMLLDEAERMIEVFLGIEFLRKYMWDIQNAKAFSVLPCTLSIKMTKRMEKS